MPAHAQRGFALTGLMVAIAIMTLLAVLGANQIRQQLDDHAAEATGRYLLRLRGALINLQLKHEAWLRATDTATALPGTYPDTPDWQWHTIADAQVIRGDVQDLIAQHVLPADMPVFTPLGERAQFILVRQGTCPDNPCQIQAFAYTCHPISRQSSSRSGTSCSVPGGARAQVHPALLGKVMLSTEGYGGHDVTPDQQVRGKLFQARRAWFGLASPTGYAVVTASLDDTPLNQFVRHGDTRPVVLHNHLSVDGTIQTNTGLLFGETVSAGLPCLAEGMVGSTGTALAICLNGQWNVLGNHLVAGVFNHLTHDTYVPPPHCPVPMQPWRHIAITATDVVVGNGDLNIRGTAGGGLRGSGAVNAAGQVAISGSFSGTFEADPASTVRVHQSVRLSSTHRVIFEPRGARARATVIQGCKS